MNKRRKRVSDLVDCLIAGGIVLGVILCQVAVFALLVGIAAVIVKWVFWG